MAVPQKVALDKRKPCYHCGKDIEYLTDVTIMKFPVVGNNGKIVQRNRHFHFDCLSEFRKTFYDKEVRIQENDEWKDVADYFKEKLLGLPSGSPIPQHAVMRLLGMRVGKYYPNGDNTRILKRGYSFKVMLIALKVVKVKHMSYIKSQEFKDIGHKINLIMKMLEKEIDLVYLRQIRQNKSNEKLAENINENNFDYKALYDNVRVDEKEKVSIDIVDVENEDDDISIDYENDF